VTGASGTLVANLVATKIDNAGNDGDTLLNAGRNVVEDQLGANQMSNINKSFLNQQMAQGKTFLFTGNLKPPPRDILRNWNFLTCVRMDMRL
jgi:gluconate kinase